MIVSESHKLLNAFYEASLSVRFCHLIGEHRGLGTAGLVLHVSGKLTFFFSFASFQIEVSSNDDGHRKSTCRKSIIQYARNDNELEELRVIFRKQGDIWILLIFSKVQSMTAMMLCDACMQCRLI